MLQSLRIRNVAIVEDASVEFGPGLNVITGETGAGKSVMLGALAMVLGERADKGIIRAGATQCGVDAVFHLDPRSPQVHQRLEELGLPPCEGGQLVVRRSVSASGSGRAFVNDAPATVQALKQLGDALVDIHGPHDHQSLLSADYQLDLLDAFGHLDEQRTAYAKAYERLLELRNERKSLDEGGTDTAQLIDLLRHQVGELESAELESLDEENLKQEHAACSNAQEVLRIGSALGEALTGAETSALNVMGAVQQQADSLHDMLDAAAEWKQEAKRIAIEIKELSDAVEQRLRTVSADPERLQFLDDRLTLLHRLKRKYGNSVADLIAYRDRSRERLAGLEGRGDRIRSLERETEAATAAVRETGRSLGSARRKAARRLAQGVTESLRDLGFPHSAFFVDVAESPEPRPSGLDTIEFGFAPNAGEPTRPLRAIASSGEISRVMLGVKTVLAAHDRIPVLVFDEVDANVGGETSVAVGAKLAAVAERRQVICITHLPQVAVRGITHLQVRKRVADGRTHAAIAGLEGDARVEEIARMLGGRDLTTVTLRHARELLRSVRSDR
jgi:DNA repair protein RecN (Recombination protein N)